MEIELVYVGNDHYQTVERIPDDSASGADYWACYIPRVIAKKLGLTLEQGSTYRLKLVTTSRR